MSFFKHLNKKQVHFILLGRLIIQKSKHCWLLSNNRIEPAAPPALLPDSSCKMVLNSNSAKDIGEIDVIIF
jgi:hypothetical protein